MSVHMFRIIAAKPSNIGQQQANQLVEQWFASYTPWEDDPNPHDIILVDSTLTDSPEHFRGDLRFERDSDMSTIREQIETDLKAVTSWYRIAYHECTHDGSSGGDCSWNLEINYGNVPTEVPTFE
jgi:hypothetical protein